MIKPLGFLELFSKHLFEAGINDANEFSNNPLKYFNPFTNTQTEKQDWWNKLTSECLASLLDFSEEVTEGNIILEANEPLLKAQAGLPHIFRNKVSLKISLNEAADPDDSMQVSIHRAVGNSRFQLMDDKLSVSQKIHCYLKTMKFQLMIGLLGIKWKWKGTSLR